MPNNEKKPIFRILIIVIAILLIAAVVVACVTDNGNSSGNEAGQQTDIQIDTSADADPDSEDELKPQTEISGAWIDFEDLTDPEELIYGPYKAYQFTDPEYITRVTMSSPSNDQPADMEQIRGLWKIDDPEKGKVHIIWQNEQGETTSEQTMSYEVKDGNLILDGETYYKMPDNNMFQDIFY